MKVLSIKQPYAWLIIHGGKNIENRTWNTTFRGRFLIHASKTPDLTAPAEVWALVPAVGLCFGGIVGSVELVDVVNHSDSKWFFGPKGFVLRDPEEVPFVPMKGRLGFFEYEEGL